MKNLVGVMQGRLLPKYQGRYQAHPKNYWKEEFNIAKNMGLNCIEFILDFDDAESNPLLKPGGIEDIKSIIDESGVQVKTICADYFMDAPIHSKDLKQSNKSQEIILKLIDNAAKLGVSDIVIPCVDNSSIKEDSISIFIKQISKLLEIVENHNINLSLETDLPPGLFVELLNSFDSNRVTVNYDIGNSASLGFDPVEELNCYGNKISDIHIKDRELNGGPVMLGQGNANFDIFFSKLNEFDYCGPFIMQVYRDNQGLEVFKEQLEFIKPYFE